MILTPSSSMNENTGSRTATPLTHSDASAPGSLVRLQVCERWFTTSRETLVRRSTFFEALLSSRWKNAREDGSYFVDADPTLFDHILRYLRRPNVFPIFYDPAKGHDLVLYNALLEEARYFMIDELINWFEGEGYLNSVTVNHTVTVIDREPSFLGIVYDGQEEPNTQVTFHPQLVPLKVYVCPRGLYVHRGKEWKCGKACKKAQGNSPPAYEEVMEGRVVVIKRKTTIGTDLDADKDPVYGVCEGHGVWEANGVNGANGPSLI